MEKEQDRGVGRYICRYAWQSLKQKLFQSVLLGCFAALVAFLVFAGTLLGSSMESGIGRMKERLGADLMIVPHGQQGKTEKLLLTGNPEFSYLDRDLEQVAANTKGVKKTTSQFYFSSVSADCCSTRVQLIAFDPGTDFAVLPWINQEEMKKTKKGQVLIGADVIAQGDHTIRFYGEKHPVAGKLSRTATGLDQSVFMTRDTMNKILEDAKKKGFHFLSPKDKGKVSAVLIKAEEGANLDKIETSLLKKATAKGDKIDIVSTQKVIGTVSAQYEFFRKGIRFLQILFILTSSLVLFLIFSFSYRERKKEFAVLRIVGVTTGRIRVMTCTQGGMISLIGGLIGLLTGALVLFPFRVLISDSLQVPMITPAAVTIAFVALMALVLTVLLGVAAADIAIRTLGRAETYFTLREGEA